jgi:hypothetical protein
MPIKIFFFFQAPSIWRIRKNIGGGGGVRDYRLIFK